MRTPARGSLRRTRTAPSSAAPSRWKPQSPEWPIHRTATRVSLPPTELQSTARLSAPMANRLPIYPVRSIAVSNCVVPVTPGQSPGVEHVAVILLGPDCAVQRQYHGRGVAALAFWPGLLITLNGARLLSSPEHGCAAHAAGHSTQRGTCAYRVDTVAADADKVGARRTTALMRSAAFSVIMIVGALVFRSSYHCGHHGGVHYPQAFADLAP
jgi:hypothetical protein